MAAECHLKDLSRDLLVNVMARLDGLSLAAAACTCTELLDLATERGLWESLCHTTWPSTACPEAKNMVVPFNNKFYAQSRPLILYDDSVGGVSGMKTAESFAAEDLVSLVDVFYKGVCVLSKVIDGIPEAGSDRGEQHQKWFDDCPFELDVVKFDYSQGNGSGEDEDVVTEDAAGNLSQELEEDVRLSWVLLNKKTGKSVNVSSCKPLKVKNSWIYSNNYTFQFGCVVPVEVLAECVITARCERRNEKRDISGGLKWEEIGMSIKDMAGAHLGGKKSLTVLNKAMYCARSNDPERVRRGYERLEKLKKEMKC
ncbi:unnamed protein product [Rhodiola kirilowii]